MKSCLCVNRKEKKIRLACGLQLERSKGTENEQGEKKN